MNLWEPAPLETCLEQCDDGFGIMQPKMFGESKSISNTSDINSNRSGSSELSAKKRRSAKPPPTVLTMSIRDQLKQAGIDSQSYLMFPKPQDKKGVDLGQNDRIKAVLHGFRRKGENQLEIFSPGRNYTSSGFQSPGINASMFGAIMNQSGNSLKSVNGSTKELRDVDDSIGFQPKLTSSRAASVSSFSHSSLSDGKSDLFLTVISV